MLTDGKLYIFTDSTCKVGVDVIALKGNINQVKYIFIFSYSDTVTTCRQSESDGQRHVLQLIDEVKS